jgi:hypothetical protein
MIVAQTGSPEAAYIMAAFLLFLSAGMTFFTKAPRSLREKAQIIGHLEPGQLYHGYFIYQPGFVSETGADAAAVQANLSSAVVKRIPRLFTNRKDTTRKTG